MSTHAYYFDSNTQSFSINKLKNPKVYNQINLIVFKLAKNKQATTQIKLFLIFL